MNIKDFNKVDVASMDTEDTFFETREAIEKQVRRITQTYKPKPKKESKKA